MNARTQAGDPQVKMVETGRSWLRVFLFGDTDEGAPATPSDEFDARPGAVLREMWTGGVSLPWNLALAAAIGLWLMFTRVLGADCAMANADHLMGALALTIVSLAAAEMARPLRFLLVPLEAALLITAFTYQPGMTAAVASLVCGVGLTLASLRRGVIVQRYSGWQRLIL